MKRKPRLTTEKWKSFLNLIGIFADDTNIAITLTNARTLKEFDKLYNVFVKNDLFTILFTLDNFHNYYGEKTPFMSAIKYLEKLNLNTYNARYMILNCKMYANLAESYIRKSFKYDVVELATQLDTLKQDFPEHTVMIDILLSKTYVLLKEHKMESITILKKIRTKDKELNAYVLYLLAEQCKGLEIFRELRYNSLESAYKLSKNYKVCYELGREYLSLNVCDSAEKYLKECLEFLNKKSFLLPIEQHYYFYTFANLADIKFKSKDYNNAITYADKALDFKEELYEKQNTDDVITKAYYRIYKENPVKYMEYEISTMNSVPLYRLLGNACTELGMTDKAECYFKYLKSLD